MGPKVLSSPRRRGSATMICHWRQFRGGATCRHSHTRAFGVLNSGRPMRIVCMGRVASAEPDAGTSLKSDAVAACVIGSASLIRRSGIVFGACLGALLMVSLDNGMSLKEILDFIQNIVKGGVSIAAVGLDMLGPR